MSDPICANCGGSILECQGFCERKVKDNNIQSLEEIKEDMVGVLYEYAMLIENSKNLMDRMSAGDRCIAKLLSIEVGGEVIQECWASKTCRVDTCIKDNMTRQQRFYCRGKFSRPKTVRDCLEKGR